MKRPCDNFVLLHLQRAHLPEWVRAVMAVALGVGPRQQLPPVILQESTENRYAQLGEDGGGAGPPQGGGRRTGVQGLTPPGCGAGAAHKCWRR